MELAVQISQIVSAVGITVAILTYLLNRKKMYFQTMQRCIMDYRKIMHEHQSTNNKSDKMSIALQHDLFGLFNEQLFYIKRKYVPDEISKEWLKTIIETLRDKEEKAPNVNLRSFERVTKICKLIKDYGEKPNIIFNKYTADSFDKFFSCDIVDD